MLDADIYGPNSDARRHHRRRPKAVVPPWARRVRVSLALIAQGDQAVVWRALRREALAQFLIRSRALDYLLVDLPPALATPLSRRSARADGAIVVLTPQDVALDDDARLATNLKAERRSGWSRI